jgi:hypothetical protein
VRLVLCCPPSCSWAGGPSALCTCGAGSTKGEATLGQVASVLSQSKSVCVVLLTIIMAPSARRVQQIIYSAIRSEGQPRTRHNQLFLAGESRPKELVSFHCLESAFAEGFLVEASLSACPEA